MGARVEVTSPVGSRQLALDEFLTGYRETALRADELVTAVLVPKAFTSGRAAFEKLGSRAYLVISIVMVAVALETDDEQISAARLAVGSCSPVAQRLSALERELVGLPWPPPSAIRELVDSADLSALRPIDDIRAPGAYRLDAVRTLLLRAITSLDDTALGADGEAA
jgi:CO/xanthine dehydrogenase FAD-binding subunit